MSEAIEWEYKVLQIKSLSVESSMNRLGAAGWELVAVIPGNEDTWGSAYFKRRVKPKK